MKRLVVCCDGTWQNLANLCPTNIVKLSQSVKRVADDGIPQIVFYGAGIGSENKKILGGTTGLGIDQSIQDAYKFLCLNSTMRKVDDRWKIIVGTIHDVDAVS